NENFQQYQHLFQISTDIILISRFDGKLLKVNPAFPKLLGCEKEEVLKKNIMDFVHPEDLNNAMKVARGIQRGAPIINVIHRFLTKDNKTIWIEYTAMPEMEAD